MATIIRCNMCGNDIDNYNKGLNIDHTYGYNSKFDCNSLNIDLCVDCLDKLTQHLIDNCKINPIID